MTIETKHQNPEQLLTPVDVASQYPIPVNTQAVWRSTNQYGFRAIVIKVGRRIAYRRRDIESWLETRRIQNLN